MTTFRRDRQLAATLASIDKWEPPEEVIVVDDANEEATRELCKLFGVRYIPRLDRPHGDYANPSVPINIGLRAARGDIVILQNAECRHDSNVVEQFRARVKPRTASFAKVAALEEDGRFGIYYVAPKVAERPYFFCGAMFREHFEELGGMDENFDQPGFDDEDFATRMEIARLGLDFADDILVSHQWHDRPKVNLTPMLNLYFKKHASRFNLPKDPVFVMQGDIVVNRSEDGKPA